MKSCPWCTEEVAGELPVEFGYLAVNNAYYYTYCPACGASGPRCKTKEAALAAWGNRKIMVEEALTVPEVMALVEWANPREHLWANGCCCIKCLVTAPFLAAMEKKP